MYSLSNFFNGGMNTDDEDRLVPTGDYRSASYSRSYSVGTSDNGALQSMTGNLLIENPDLPRGKNVIIGSCEDIEGKGYKAGNLILFSWNSEGNHSIWRYNVVGQEYQLILQDSILNFKLQNRIYHAAVVDGLLYWTDNYFNSYELDPTGLPDFNPPRKINIQKAILYTESGGTDPEGYSEITFDNLDWIKHPPLFSPTGQYITDTTESANNLKNKLFQFRYQYIYDDKEESAWSPISDLFLPNESEYISGTTNINPYIDNTIRLNISTGSSIAKIIRVAYRIGNNSEFFLYKEFIKSEQGWSDYSNVTVDFKNETAGVPISNSERNYDLVPQIAKCVEYLPSNEFAMGNIIEGYDKPDLTGVNFDFDININTIDNTAFTAPLANFFNFYNSGLGRKQYISFSNINGNNFVKYRFEPGDIIVLQLKDYTGGTYNANVINPDVVLYYTVPVIDELIYDTDDLKIYFLCLDLSNFLSLNGVSSTVIASGSVFYNGNFINWPILEIQQKTWYNQTSWQLDNSNTESYFFNINILRSNESKRTFKTGATHEFAIQYYDRANRDGTVLTIPTGSVYNPFYYDYDDGYLNNPCSLMRKPFYTTMRMTIPSDFQPPIWATNYQVLYKPSTNIANFQQRSVIKATYNPDTTVKLSLDNYYKPNYEGASINQTPSKGDFVRFVRKRALFNKERKLTISNGLNIGVITRNVNAISLDYYRFDFVSSPPTFDYLNVICDPESNFTPPAAFTSQGGSYYFECKSNFNLSWDLGYSDPTSIKVTVHAWDLSTGVAYQIGGDIYYDNISNGMNISVNQDGFVSFALGVQVSYGINVEFIGGGGAGTYSPTATLDILSYEMSVYYDNIDYDNFNYYPSYISNSDDIAYELNVLSYNPGDENEGESITVNYFDLSIIGKYLMYTGSNNNRGFASGGFQIEIYTPKKESENDPWYETGIEWDIIDPHTQNRRHDGDTAQVLNTTNAVVDLDCGDVYIRQRIMATGYDYDGAYEDVNDANDIRGAWFCEDPHYSDYYISNWNNKGRLGLFSPFAKRQELKTTVYHTNSLIDNSQINGLSQVEFQNQVSLKDEFGPINRLMHIGDTLKAFQDRKISSIYVQKAFGLNGDGTNNVVISDQTFASIRPHDDDYGCVHPGGIVKSEGNIYAYDYYNSTFIAITSGGIYNICNGDRKFMNGAFTFTQNVNENSGVLSNIQSHINRSTGEYIIYTTRNSSNSYVELEVASFKAPNTIVLVGDVTSLLYVDQTIGVYGAVNSENNLTASILTIVYDPVKNVTNITISGTVVNEIPAGKYDVFLYYNTYAIREDGVGLVYSYILQRWVSHIEHGVLHATYLGNKFFTVGDKAGDFGSLYEENSGDELTFFGNGVEQNIQFIFNESPSVVKRFYTHLQQANYPFRVEVSVPPNQTYPNGMASDIPVAALKNQEGYYVSRYFRDATDPRYPSSAIAKLNGRELRGYVLNHSLFNDDTTRKKILMSVGVNFTPSEPFFQ